MTSPESIECTKCGTLNSVNDRYCRECGQYLPKVPIRNNYLKHLKITRETIADNDLHFYDYENNLKLGIKNSKNYIVIFLYFIFILIFPLVLIISSKFLPLPSKNNLSLFMIESILIMIPLILIFIITVLLTLENLISMKIKDMTNFETLGKIKKKIIKEKTWTYIEEKRVKPFIVVFKDKSNGIIKDKKNNRELYFETENEYNTQVFTEEREQIMRLKQGTIEQEIIKSYETIGCKDFEVDVLQELDTVLVVFIATVLIIKNTHELNKEKRKRTRGKN